jgi:phosphopantetheinyl transferase
MEKVYIEFWESSTLRDSKTFKEMVYLSIAERVAELSGGNTVEILRVPGEKPRLKESTGWHFNLSHSEDIILCGYSNNSIGIDLEVHKKRNLSELSEHWFHREEQQYLGAQPHSKQFYQLWTKKEAWIKMKGLSVWEMSKTPVMTSYNRGCLSRYLRWNNKDYSLSLCLENSSDENIELIQLSSWPDLLKK